MRPWYWSVIIGILLIAVALIGQKKRHYKIANIARKIISLTFLCVGLFFGSLGVIYIGSDIKALIEIQTRHMTYPEGPGLGLTIGVAFLLFIATPLVVSSILIFKYRNKIK